MSGVAGPALGGYLTVEVDGTKRTLSIYPDVYASPLNGRDEVVDALKQSELGQYVAENYNTNSLTSFVREVWKELRQAACTERRLVSEDDLRLALPAPLASVLKLSLIHKLSSTKKA